MHDMAVLGFGELACEGRTSRLWLGPIHAGNWLQEVGMVVVVVVLNG